MLDHPDHILEWLVEMGDDVPLAEAPINRFDESTATAKIKEKAAAAKQIEKGSPKASLQTRVAALKQSTNAKSQPKSAAVLPDETVITAARELAVTAETIGSLKAAISKFDGCNLRRNAKNTVFSTGDPQAKLWLIDEHPGRNEDQQGTPFGGRSGGLLEKMLATINLKITDVYQVAALPWHPPGSRTPTPAELEICKPFLERHIELASPKFVIAMGNTPSRMLFQPDAQALNLRGKWQEKQIGNAKFQILATLSPSFLLKHPSQKRLAWQDLLMIRAKI